MPQNDLLLEVNDLRTYFYLDQGIARAVDGVSFDIRRGGTLGVLGESGCGKSITALSILRLVQRPGRIESGQILYHRRSQRGNGAGDTTEVVDLARLDPYGQEIRSIRGAEIAIIFQEPMTFMTPVYTVGSQITEAIVLHQRVSPREARERAVAILQGVGMPDAREILDRYPHQLSGGMRQRAIIAIALSCHPSLLIADEPTTALDVTTEAQILELMKQLRRDLGMSIMYITHSLGVIAEMADEVVVMYLGKVVERANVISLFQDPRHPYTQALLASIPKIGRKSRKPLNAIQGMVPDPSSIPSGCAFHTRCSMVQMGVCDQVAPELLDTGGGHLVRCLLYGGAGGQR
jgi:peptide/nickel transport system ATP-binding protein